MEQEEPFTSTPIDELSGVRILSPDHDPSKQYDLHIADGKVDVITAHDSTKAIAPGARTFDASNHLIAPSLCHAHIHLDKCFLLSDPKYADLAIIHGDFEEAMKSTGKAKARFKMDDLMRRGRWLIAESIAAGVTCMRAFVEVDHIVMNLCLDAAVELKNFFTGACEIQICVFAQEPLYSGHHAEENRTLIWEAAGREEVDVVGSTPYVEDRDAITRNIAWTLEVARKRHIYLDLHLDYNLDASSEIFTHYVLAVPGSNNCKGTSIGHCTRLTKNTAEEWQKLESKIGTLPVHFVGLPTSDLYIQGKPDPESGGGERPRGTLQIPQMIQRYGLSGCIAINNVGNAFTPHGSCDPLSIASMGVGLYHAGTKQDAQLLYECVSTRAKDAIGLGSKKSPFEKGQPADFVLFDMGGREHGRLSGRRGRRTLMEIVYDPPKERKTLCQGNLISI